MVFRVLSLLFIVVTFEKINVYDDRFRHATESAKNPKECS